MEQRRWGSIPFQFEFMWFGDELLWPLAKEWREDINVVGTTRFMFWKKLKMLKKKQVNWRGNVYGVVENKIRKELMS